MNNKWISIDMGSSNEGRACQSHVPYFIVISNKKNSSPSPPAFPQEKTQTTPSPKIPKSLRKTKQFEHLERFRTWFRYSRPGGKFCVCDTCFQRLVGSTGLFCSGRSEEPGR